MDLGHRARKGRLSRAAIGIGGWHLRTIAAALCISLVAGVLAVTRFEPEAGPHAPKPVDVLESEAPNEESASPDKVDAASTSFGGVGWSASRSSDDAHRDLDTGTLAARAEAEVPSSATPTPASTATTTAP